MGLYITDYKVEPRSGIPPFSIFVSGYLWVRSRKTGETKILPGATVEIHIVDPDGLEEVGYATTQTFLEPDPGYFEHEAIIGKIGDHRVWVEYPGYEDETDIVYGCEKGDKGHKKSKLGVGVFEW